MRGHVVINPDHIYCQGIGCGKVLYLSRGVKGDLIRETIDHGIRSQVEIEVLGPSGYCIKKN